MPRALFIALLCLVATTAHSDCECLWQGSFSEVQASTSLVLSGTVVEGKGNSIDLSVDRLLRGTVQVEPIRIWLQTADYCRP